MRNESRKARVAARSSCASRSRSSWAAAARSSGSRSNVAKARCRSGTWPCCADSSRPSAWATAILSCGANGASSTRDVMASWAGVWASRRSAVNTGVRIASPTTTPMWRAPMVHPACCARGRRISIAWEVSRSMVSPSPRPTSAWGAIVQARWADGGIARADQSTGDEEAAHRDLDLGRRPQEAGERASGESRDRHDGHGQRRSRRGAAPALDQEQDQQEQRRRERRREQGEGQVGAHGRTVPVRLERRYGTNGERGRHRQHGERHLDHEDGLPRDRLREQSARDRSGGRADHPGRDPGRDAAALAVHRDQELQAADQRQARLRPPARTEPRSAPRSSPPARTTPRSRRTPRYRGQ